MKIQPIIYSFNSFSNSVPKHSVNKTSDNLQINELSNCYYYPINFQGTPKRTFSTDRKKLAEKSGNFKIARFSDVPCPACGKKMLNVAKFHKIAAHLATLPEEKYLDCLKEYKEYMRPVEESVFNEIYELSKKPNSSKDIRELLVSLRNKKLPILQEAQMHQIKKMNSLAKTLPMDEKTILLSKINGLKQIIYKNNAEAPFRRKILLDRISKVKIRNPKKYEKLQNIAKSFPTSSDMNSAWIVKYSGKNKNGEDWDSYDIALRFLSSSIANTDHIIAYGIENNHDDISNYLAMHNSCNSQKSNKAFLHWLHEDKDKRIQYIQDYFDYVEKELIGKKIKNKKYRDYVAYATETIGDASLGQLILTSNQDETEGN